VAPRRCRRAGGAAPLSPRRCRRAVVAAPLSLRRCRCTDVAACHRAIASRWCHCIVFPAPSSLPVILLSSPRRFRRAGIAASLLPHRCHRAIVAVCHRAIASRHCHCIVVPAPSSLPVISLSCRRASNRCRRAVVAAPLSPRRCRRGVVAVLLSRRHCRNNVSVAPLSPRRFAAPSSLVFMQRK
jgi:hypothetical protein